MTEQQKKTDDIFENSFTKSEPVYWWYAYEDAVFRTFFEKGKKTRFFVKHIDVDGGKEYEVFKKDSNMLMDTIVDLNKVLITKEDYENFPAVRAEYMKDEWTK